MNCKIIFQEPFNKAVKRLAKKYSSLKSDLIKLQDELLQNPNAGVDLGNGVRKVRMSIASKGKGKSHGARVITFTVIISVEETVINLLTIYDKAERENISISEIKELMNEVGLI